MTTILISKVTRKGQTTIPQSIRAKLDITTGDSVIFVLRGAEVVLQKLTGLDNAYLQAVEDTLGEWSSVEDDKAYFDL